MANEKLLYINNIIAGIGLISYWVFLYIILDIGNPLIGFISGILIVYCFLILIVRGHKRQEDLRR